HRWIAYVNTFFLLFFATLRPFRQRLKIYHTSTPLVNIILAFFRQKISKNNKRWEAMLPILIIYYL
ncbi:MAG: hypothetical protein ACOX7H_04150, partial [Bacillota bacterium]